MTDIKSKKPNSPHDEFYKQALSNLKVAQELFDNFLPKYVRELIDLSTLKPSKDTFSDSLLGNFAADAIFSVSFAGSDGYLVLHSEHQSTSEHFMALRIKKYQTLIYEQYRSINPKSKHLPLVYSMVYYTGIGKYTAPLDFYDLFLDPTLARKLNNDPYQLIDLHRVPDEDFGKALWVGAMMSAMKLAKLENIAPHMITIKPMLEVIAKENSLYIQMIFSYIIRQADTDKVTQVIKTFQETAKPEDREAIMTIAERLIEKGKIEGLEQGILQGLEKGIEKGREEGIEKGAYVRNQQVALNMLEEKVDKKLISKVTGLSLDEINSLAN